ncbi:hypothetical protein [Halomonas sp. JS92-SW72]|uniref:hypothetical protein n=1 Tax=Halomonas sp. JS92-SW72 TaxID=2306583 RepID=UPI000E5A9453|nr:hypothetical protein [Halomonas sp. JS92-SW72]AXY41620.1 hypothetical protein D1793_05095 [Halomonas sp. JS92-SW72]
MSTATQGPTGPRCTITIEQGEAGVIVAAELGEGLDFREPMLTQALALSGIDAINRQLADLREIAEASGQPLHPTRPYNH